MNGLQYIGYRQRDALLYFFGIVFFESGAWHSHDRKSLDHAPRIQTMLWAYDPLFGPLLDGCRQLLARLSMRLLTQLRPSKITHTAVR
jgi:hypothetical protein